MTDEPEDTTGEQQAAAGLKREITDHTLTLYDAAEVRERMLMALDDVIALGFGCDLMARPIRSAVELRLKVVQDGRGERPIRTLQAIADRHSLDLLVSAQVGDRLELILYPRA